VNLPKIDYFADHLRSLSNLTMIGVFLELPDNVWLKIIDNLEMKDVNNLHLVCKKNSLL
jgi:hypothetical protein